MGTPQFVAIAAQDAMLHLISMVGRKLLHRAHLLRCDRRRGCHTAAVHYGQLLPPPALAPQVALLGASRDMLVVVLSNGVVQTWNATLDKV